MDNAFGINIIPENEQERLENLYKYKILDTPREPIFDQLAIATATLFDVPVALISFVDGDRVWTKADSKGEITLEEERSLSLCSLAILQLEVTVFEDATKVQYLQSHPLIADSYGLRFFAAAPIITREGYSIGAVCLVDFKPRKLSTDSYTILELIANSVTKILEEKQAQPILEL